MAGGYRILYLDDEEIWEKLLRGHLTQINELRLNQKFRARVDLIWVKSPEAFMSALAAEDPFDLALVDLNLGGDAAGEGRGKDLLQQLNGMEGAPPRVVLTARPWEFPVQDALDTGISEYHLKDTLIADASHQVGESHQESLRTFLETWFDLPSRYDFASEEGRARFGLGEVQAHDLQTQIVGDELGMWKVKAEIAAAACSDLPVLITGERGTGKDLAAQMIHRLSERGRKGQAWISLNCAAFTPELLMSEVFGHVTGAYAGAITDKRGLLEEADGSTLFLDQVGYAGDRLLDALQRALTTGRARRLGGVEEYSFDVRVIAAASQDETESASADQRFIRHVGGLRIHMPALRHRRADIDVQQTANGPAKLISHLAQPIGRKIGKSVRFNPAAIITLAQHEWPANVRELSHVIEAAAYDAARQSASAAEVIVYAAQIRWYLRQSAGTQPKAKDLALHGHPGKVFPPGSNFSNVSLLGESFAGCRLVRASFRGSDLSGANFRGSNLTGADFERATLAGADFRGATLYRVRFRGASLVDADFRGAKLREADFTDASGLGATKFANADLTAATLPAAVAPFPEIERLEEPAKSGRKLFTALLLACAYSWLAIATTTHDNLMANSPSLPLPVIATTIPLLWFYTASPLALLGLYVYFHLHLRRLWQGLGTLPAIFPDGRRLSHRAFPWVLCDYAWYHIPKLEESSKRSAKAEHGVICALTWWVVPATVAGFWLRALPRQTWPLTLAHAGAVILAVGLAVAFQRHAASAVRGRTNQPLLVGPVGNDRRFYARLVSLAGLVAVVVWISWAALTGARGGGLRGAAPDIVPATVEMD